MALPGILETIFTVPTDFKEQEEHRQYEEQCIKNIMKLLKQILHAPILRGTCILMTFQTLVSCTSFETRDISSYQPFHSEINKSQILQEKVFLVKEGKDYVIHTIAPEDPSPFITIPAGAKVNLLSVTHLRCRYPAPFIPLPISSQSIAAKCRLFIHNKEYIAYFQWLSDITESSPHIHVNIRKNSNYLRKAPWEPSSTQKLRILNI